MRIVFLSNYFNHHQDELSDELYKRCNHDYMFVETENMPEERINMGWSNSDVKNFIYSYNDIENREKIVDWIKNADAVILGNAPDFLVDDRIKAGKIVFKYTERIFKKGVKWYELPFRAIKYWYKWGRYKNYFLLCAGAYVYSDFSKCLTFKNRAYNWGYFPQTYNYENIKEIISKKQTNSIVWVGRMIDWKHPEVSIKLTKELIKEGYKFNLTMIGTGEMSDKIKKCVYEENLSEYINLIDRLSPNEVRQKMINSKIFIFTSDQNEGWGAVLNEAMNSGCAVIASHAIGAVPFLIKNGMNGFVYKDGEFNDLFEKVRCLLNRTEIADSFGMNAYMTIKTQWNANIAAERLLNLIADLQRNNISNKYENGICSKAKLLKMNWYKKGKSELSE